MKRRYKIDIIQDDGSVSTLPQLYRKEEARRVVNTHVGTGVIRPARWEDCNDTKLARRVGGKEH